MCVLIRTRIWILSLGPNAEKSFLFKVGKVYRQDLDELKIANRA